ncbi:hypothetical protein [Streptomyces phytophilus]|uniref:hypothetical protein n=1 Tax=Streptomyces phytophilus TaxID=722715 RepID=UPI0015F01730|nr:hypothetical protein [Streptomyces phytophilus]
MSNDRRDYMVRVGNVAVRRDCFTPHPEAQAIANVAATTHSFDCVQALRQQADDEQLLNAGIDADDTGEPDMLRDYLDRRAAVLNPTP